MKTYSGSAQRNFEKYAQGVIIRDNSLSLYDQFLRNMGENMPLFEIAKQYISDYQPIRVLDIGCGNAQAMHQLKEQIGEYERALGHAGKYIHTIGIDLLPPEKGMLDEFIQGDVHEVAFPQECDVVLSFRALHEIGRMLDLLPRIAQSLARGGRAYLWIRMREVVEQTPVFVGEMNEKEEKALFELGLKKKLGACDVLIQPVEIPIPVNHENDPRETAIGGYIVVIHHP